MLSTVSTVLAAPVGFDLTSDFDLAFGNSVEVFGDGGLFGLSGFDSDLDDPVSISVDLNGSGFFDSVDATEFDVIFGSATTPDLLGRTVLFDVNAALNQISILFELSINAINDDPFLYVEIGTLLDTQAASPISTLGVSKGGIDVFEGARPIEISPIPLPAGGALLLGAFGALALVTRRRSI